MVEDEFLEYIPVRKCEHEVTDGVVTVYYKRSGKSLFDKIFFKGLSKKPSKIDLDEIGSFIWLLIDGKRNIESIITESRKQFNQKIEPAEERVITFFKQMAGTKLVEMYKKR